MSVMHTFRYNLAAKTWVLVGGPLALPHITPAHLLESGRATQFIAANYPKGPFVVEPSEASRPHSLLYPEQDAVGEYELLLYTGHKKLADWKVAEWVEWLELLQHRIRMLHHNPYLHHLQIFLHSHHITTTAPYHRVGDLIATSQPLKERQEISAVQVEKLLAKESLFIVHADTYGFLQVASAPTHSKELWYIPRTPRPGIDSVHGTERENLAKILAYMAHSVYGESESFGLEIHTAFAGKNQDVTWWLQAYQGSNAPVLEVQRPPESFVQHFMLHT
jgi:hypothetical protein